MVADVACQGSKCCVSGQRVLRVKVAICVMTGVVCGVTGKRRDAGRGGGPQTDQPGENTTVLVPDQHRGVSTRCILGAIVYFYASPEYFNAKIL